jgi:hypothetical protein
MRIGRYVLAGLLTAALAPLVGAAPEVGERAPRITAAKWWNLPKGMKKIEMGDLKGRVVLVEFWATW